MGLIINHHPHFVSGLMQTCVPQILVVHTHVFVQHPTTHTRNVEGVVRNGGKEGPLLLPKNSFLDGRKSVRNG